MSTSALASPPAAAATDRDGIGVSVEAFDISKFYRSAGREPIQALDRVSLSLAAGEFVSIVGPSGCGKSTLMMLVSGLIPASTGTIRIGGRPVAGPVQQAGIVFQRDMLLDWRSVLSNVLLPVQIKRLDAKTHRRKALDLLDAVGLAGFEDKYPSELSGGMRQRVAICRALVQSPGLLLMDEPFGALDALTREQMNFDLQRMWLADRNTVLFITHSIEEAVFLADRVVVMSDRPGRVAEIVEVPLQRPRGAQTRSEPAFVRAVERLRASFMAQGILSEG